MEDKIEVGEYVRIDKSRFLGIGKVVRIVSNTVYIKMYISLPISFSDEEIKKYKHSKNLKDLLEAGDIVKYSINNLTAHKIGEIKEYRDARSFDEYLGVEGFSLNQVNIKQILTRELFAANCYEVEG